MENTCNLLSTREKLQAFPPTEYKNHSWSDLMHTAEYSVFDDAVFDDASVRRVLFRLQKGPMNPWGLAFKHSFKCIWPTRYDQFTNNSDSRACLRRKSDCHCQVRSGKDIDMVALLNTGLCQTSMLFW